MSPLACLIFLAVLSFACLIAGAVLAVFSRRLDFTVAGFGLVLLSFLIALPSRPLYDYATGRATYELRRNADGSETWQRVVKP